MREYPEAPLVGIGIILRRGETVLLIQVARVIPSAAAAAGDCEVAHPLTVDEERRAQA